MSFGCHGVAEFPRRGTIVLWKGNSSATSYAFSLLPTFFASYRIINHYKLYLFGLLATGIGEAVVLYALGLPLWRALLSSPLVREFVARADTADGGRTSIDGPPTHEGKDATGSRTDRHVTERI